MNDHCSCEEEFPANACDLTCTCTNGRYSPGAITCCGQRKPCPATPDEREEQHATLPLLFTFGVVPQDAINAAATMPFSLSDESNWARRLALWTFLTLFFLV